MPQYSGPKATTKKGSSVIRTATPPIVVSTYEGDKGFLKDEKSALFTLGATFMSENDGAFYETGSDRQQRFVGLVHSVTKTDPAWVMEFIPFLRNTAQMRTASIVATAEYVRAGGPGGASLIPTVLARADEPAELLGYWLEKYGRSLPQPLKRGLARSCVALFNEYAAMKYDGGSRGVRLGDVIELTHPKAQAPWQSDLFRYLLDRRHHPTDVRVELENLPKIRAWNEINAVPLDDRREYLRNAGSDGLYEAGMTWERLSGWVPGGMDAEAWETVIPSMGYMALLRNLRNFDQAQVSASVKREIADRLSDPEQVAKSRQFPYRFISAYKEMVTEQWGAALETALDLSVRNIPVLGGRSLVLIDVSGSMRAPVSARSRLERWEAGAVFGVAQGLRAKNADIVAFATGNRGVDLRPGTSVLKGVAEIATIVSRGALSYGTEMWPAIQKHFDGHDRIFIFSDMQSFGYIGRHNLAKKLASTSIYAFDLGGYHQANMELGGDKPHYQLGGLTDATFRQIPLLEAGRNAGWPWAS